MIRTDLFELNIIITLFKSESVAAAVDYKCPSKGKSKFAASHQRGQEGAGWQPGSSCLPVNITDKVAHKKKKPAGV